MFIGVIKSDVKVIDIIVEIIVGKFIIWYLKGNVIYIINMLFFIV